MYTQQGRITPAAQFSDKRVQDQLGWDQTRMGIHATEMPRPAPLTADPSPFYSGAGAILDC
jgi:hypothetical protein